MLRYVAFAFVMTATVPVAAEEWDWALGTGSPTTRQHTRAHVVKRRPAPAKVAVAKEAAIDQAAAKNAAGVGTAAIDTAASANATVANAPAVDAGANDTTTSATAVDDAAKKAASELATAAAATSDMLQGSASTIDDNGIKCAAPVRGLGTEAADEKGALDAAKKDWMERVRYDLGESYLDIYSAKDLSSRCNREPGREDAGKATVHCEIVARPCEASLQEFSGYQH